MTDTLSNPGPSVGFYLNKPLIEDALYGDIAFSASEEQGEMKDMITGQRVGDSKDRWGRAWLRYAPTGSPLDITLSAGRNERVSDEERFVMEPFPNQRLAVPVPSHYDLTSNNYRLTVAYDVGGATITTLTGFQDRALDRTILAQELVAQPYETAFRNYELRLKALTKKLQQQSKQISGRYVPRSRFGMHAQSWLLPLLTRPPLANLMAKRMLGDAIPLE